VINLKLTKEGKVVLGGIITLYLVVIVLKLQIPADDVFHFIIRFSGLVGTTSIFIATIIASSPVQISRIYRKPFTNIHHIFAILGIIMITLHPLAFALSTRDITVFIPRFDSWRVFWELAGRPALILIYIATLIGRLRTKFPQYWRPVHALTLVALFFGVFHGMLIGTDFQRFPLVLLFVVMLGLTLIAFVRKRIQRYNLAKRRKA